MTKPVYQWLLRNRTHLIFGSNTDVGKTIVTTGLVNASLRRTFKEPISKSHQFQNHQQQDLVHYIKPLQCGGSDQLFVDRHVVAAAQQQQQQQESRFLSQVLHKWESYTSPHLASRIEGHYVSNDDVLSSLMQVFDNQAQIDSKTTTSFIETAGGVVSPGPVSPPPSNNENNNEWSTQADMYSPLTPYIPTVLVGDGKLGGISATISSLESLWLRGYHVDMIILLEPPPDDQGLNDSKDEQICDNHDNVVASTSALTNTEALQEYFEKCAKSSAAFQHYETIVKKQNNWQQQQQQQQRLLQNKILPIPPIMDSDKDIVCIAKPLPPMPEPLIDWFHDLEVRETFDAIEMRLQHKWEQSKMPNEEGCI